MGRQLTTLLRSAPAFRAACGTWLVLLVLISVLVLAGNQRTVTHAYRQGVEAWGRGGQLYSDQAVGFLYLPTAALVFAPFASLPERLGVWLWRMVTIGSFAVGVWRLSQIGEENVNATRFLIVSLVSIPLACSSARNGQATLLMAGLMMLATAEIDRRRWGAAATWLAFSLAVKPLAMVMIVLSGALYRELRRPLVLGVLGVLLVPFLAQTPDYVWRQYVGYLAMLRVAAERGQAVYWAQFFDMLRVFGVSVAHTQQTLIRIAGALAMFFLAWRAQCRYARSEAHTLMYVLAACYLLLFSPRTENNTYSLLGPALGVFTADVWLGERSHIQTAILLVSAAMVLGSYEIGRLVVPPVKAVWLAPLGCLVFSILVVGRVVGLKSISAVRSAPRGSQP